MNGYLDSLIKTGSTKHWKRYSDLEKWKKQFRLKTILDIGAGHDPFWDATHIIDKFEKNDSERGHKLKIGRREFKEESVESISYPDKFFDFIYARQIMLLVDDHSKACSEILLVG